MDLEDYWGIGPKTRQTLETEIGADKAIDAIQNADVRTLVNAGVTRGRVVRILRRAHETEGLELLETSDTRDVYRDLVDLVTRYALTEDAENRIRVMTPLPSEEDAERRLDEVLGARESWSRLSDEEHERIIDVFEEYDSEGSRKAAVDAAIRLSDIDDDRVFTRLSDLDVGALEETVGVLGIVDGDRVEEGVDEDLDQLRRQLELVDSLSDSAFDIVETVRSRLDAGGRRTGDEFREEFAYYVSDETGVDLDSVYSAAPDDAVDAADLVTNTLRNLLTDLEEAVEDRHDEVVERVETRLDEARDDVESAVEAVDDLGFLLSLARFADEYDLRRPEFSDEELGVSVVDARNLSLSAEGVDVQPVTYGVGDTSTSEVPTDRVAVLTGANSGGKTTLLETVCQTVLLAHMGLPVPAESAEVSYFDSVVFHRRHASFNAGVLESTLRSIVPPLTTDETTLMLVDEFEAITEPGSAASLLHGLVGLTVDTEATGVFVTHLADDLEPLPEQARVDGIFAEGLDDDLQLEVDYQPRFETVGRSTPEFIVSRLVANASDRTERAGFERLAGAVGEEAVQSTLDDADWEGETP
ncbi:MAG: DNA mismatch repair protein [Halobacteria archaeon]|nr:DNA mismatch repair protein [Halobacteria archaeon]